MTETGNRNSLNRKLTIRVSNNALSFATDKRAEGGGIDYEPYDVNPGMSMAANLRLAFAESRLLRHKYASVTVMMDTPVLMIPIEEFEDNNTELLYSHMFTTNKSEQILTAVLPGQNAVAAFTMNSDLKLVVNDNFPSSTIMPLMQPVWNYMHRRSFTGAHRKLFAYFHDKHVEVMSFRQNRFIYCNSFEAAHANDVLYYIMYVWKQLGLDTTDAELHMAGDMIDRDKLTELLRQYIANVYMINPAADFGFPAAAEMKGLPFDLQVYYAKGR